MCECVCNVFNLGIRSNAQSLQSLFEVTKTIVVLDEKN